MYINSHNEKYNLMSVLCLEVYSSFQKEKIKQTFTNKIDDEGITSNDE